MNSFVFSGKVISKPECRISPFSDKAVAHFTIAVKESKNHCDYFTLTAFGQNAVFVDKYVKQGKTVFVEGYVKNNNYEVDGVKKYDFDFIVNKIENGG